MTNTIVVGGQTYDLAGTLAAGSSLTADAGSFDGPAAAVITVTTAATNDGTIDLLAGGFPTYDFGYGATLDISGVLTNNGTIDAAGGAVSSYHHESFYGSQIVDSGTLDNTGLITLEGAVASTYYTPGTGATLTDTGALENAGTLLIDAGASGVYNTPGAAVEVSGVLTNTGLIAVQGSGGFGYIDAGSGGRIDITSTGTLTNSGYLIVYSGQGGPGGSLTVAGLLTNTGLLGVGGLVEAGAAALTILAGGTVDNQGTLSIKVNGDPLSNTVLDGGVLMNSGLIEMLTQDAEGYGRGQRIDVTGKLFNTGTIDIAGGFGTIKYVPEAASGATLSNAGVLFNSGLIDVFGGASDSADPNGPSGVLLDAGVMTNSGTIIAWGTHPDKYRDVILAGQIRITDALVNTGTLIAEAATQTGSSGPPIAADAGSITDSGRIDNEGTILLESARNIAYGGILTITGRLTDSGTIMGGGTLINDGLIASGGTAGLIDSALTNNGEVHVLAGESLTFAQAVSASAGQLGIFKVLGTGIVNFLTSVAASQEVVLVNQGAVLAIGDTADFAAEIAGLREGTVIDFLNQNVVSATTSGTTLTVGLHSGTEYTLNLAAALHAGASFTLTSDNKGGTDLSVTAQMGNALPHGAG